MKRMHFLAAIIAALAVGACGTSDPTAPAAPAIDRVEAEASLTDGEEVGPPEGETLCAKIVPESENAAERAGQRMILKRHDGTCPPGFIEFGGG